MSATKFMDEQVMVSVSKSFHKSATLSGVSFLKLREGMCKFPLGSLREPASRFCGEPTAVGLVYCEKCRHRAFTVKRPK